MTPVQVSVLFDGLRVDIAPVASSNGGPVPGDGKDWASTNDLVQLGVKLQNARPA